MKLNDFQRQMSGFVFHKNASQDLETILKAYPEQERNQRLAIYQNNTYHSLIEALKDLYPSVVNTIGHDLFSACAHAFLDTTPPSSAAMVDFGHELPAFLNAFQGTSEFAYLEDLAKVDLIRHLSYHAADDIPVEPNAFATMDIEQLAASTITPIASAQLLSSEFAVFDIWQLANDDRKSDDPVDANIAQSLLSIRPYAEVDLYLLDYGNFLFLKSLLEGITINEALAVADDQTDHFNPTHAISFLIQSGFVARITGE